MKKITIVGAGFSGLTLAYYLRKLGMAVEVFEREARPGGMLQTRLAEHGLVETAANAMLADRSLEDLITSLDLPLATPKPERKNRYIFWQEPRRWPLTAITTAKLTWMMGRAKFHSKDVWPKAGETVFDWAERTVNSEFEQRLLSPALQGVFGGDPKRLSASLTLSSLLEGRVPKGAMRGSIAPKGGMGALMAALVRKLRESGAEIIYDKEFELKNLDHPVVIASNAWGAAEIVKDCCPELSEKLRHCESLGLVSATLFFEPSEKDLKGFGCLFPTSQGFRSSGVVFNNCVFENRADLRSETWILGGALQPGLVALSDEEILALILKDREKLNGKAVEPVEVKITRWPRAIPHYTIQWEKILRNLEVPRPLFLHGNYLGGIGLSKIHQRSIKLAAQLKELYGQ